MELKSFSTDTERIEEKENAPKKKSMFSKLTDWKENAEDNNIIVENVPNPNENENDFHNIIVENYSHKRYQKHQSTLPE